MDITGYLCIMYMAVIQTDALSVTLTERMEPVLGETYFSSQQLLKSINPEMKQFIDVFTLPKHGVTVRGNLRQIYEQLKIHNDSGTKMNSLVIRIQEKSELKAHVLNKDQNAFTKNMTLINFRDVKELWIFMEMKNLLLTFDVYFDINRDNFASLENIHIISFYGIHCIYHNDKFKEIIPQLKVVDLQNIGWFSIDEVYKAVIGLNYPCAYYGMLLKGCTNLVQYLPHIFLPNIHNFSVSQSLEMLSERNTMNLLVIYENEPHTVIVFPKIEYMSITNNFISDTWTPKEFLPVKFPNLKVLDISGNVERKSERLAFRKFVLENLLFHESLQLFISVTEMEPLTQAEAVDFRPRYQEEAFFSPIGGPGNINDPLRNKSDICFSEVDNLELSDFKNDINLQCTLLKCLLEIPQLNCSRNILEFDYDCKLGIKFFISPLLKEIYMSNSFYVDLGLDYFRFIVERRIMFPIIYNLLDYNETVNNTEKKPRCFSQNSLLKLDMTRHSFSLMFESEFGAPVTLGAYFTGLDKLEYFIIDHVHLPQTMSLNLFYFLPIPTLKHISMRGNFLSLPSDLELCKTLKELVTVDLSQNNIHQIPKVLLKNCKRLQYVNLEKNWIQVIPTEIHMAIKDLDISVNLRNNPLSCECHDDSIETMSWLIKHHYKYEGFEEYTCYGLSDQKFVSDLDIDVHREDCQGWLLSEIIILCVLTSVATFLFIAAVFLTHKYRYRVIMILYRIKRFFCGSGKTKRKIFWFDLFVSYCNEDRIWVHNILRNQLENVHGISCCIHYRDFPVQGFISKIIHRYMAMSRYILVVMSRYSISKRWPAFELEHAQELGRREGKKIFYVKMGDLGENMTHEVAQVLDSEIYLEWPEDVRDEAKVEYFFDKLVAGIRGEQLCGSCCSGREPSSRRMPPFDDKYVELIKLKQDWA